MVELARLRPDCVPEVVAIDVERRWLLTRDAGPQLREVLVGSNDPQIWDELLPLYASLQIDVSDSVHDFLALGVPDDRPQNLPAAFEDLLPRWGAGPKLAALAPVIEDYAGRLSDTVPLSLVHEEFTDNNVHVGEQGPIILDWAEAVVGHPFAGLVNTMRGLVDRWGYEPGGPKLRRLRDLYLEPWTRFAPLAELIEHFALAYALGILLRALSWDRGLAPLDGADRAEFLDFVPEWLQVLSDTLEGKATLGT